MTPSTQDAGATGLVEEQREGVARIIIGPRNSVPRAEHRPTLRQLQDIRWEWSSEQERKEALWIADRIIAFLAASTKDQNDDG